MLDHDHCECFLRPFKKKRCLRNVTEQPCVNCLTIFIKKHVKQIENALKASAKFSLKFR